MNETIMQDPSFSFACRGTTQQFPKLAQETRWCASVEPCLHPTVLSDDPMCDFHCCKLQPCPALGPRVWNAVQMSRERRCCRWPLSSPQNDTDPLLALYKEIPESSCSWFEVFCQGLRATALYLGETTRPDHGGPRISHLQSSWKFKSFF